MARSPQSRNPMENMTARSVAFTDPDTAILAGKIENGAIHFKATKTVGAQWCTITDLTITPFGQRQIIAE